MLRIATGSQASLRSVLRHFFTFLHQPVVYFRWSKKKTEKTCNTNFEKTPFSAYKILSVTAVCAYFILLFFPVSDPKESKTKL